jgi:hypothetical protein
MTDAFDQFWAWRDKPPGSRLGIPSDLYSAVMLLPAAERSSREVVNATVERRGRLRRSGRTVWIYLNDYNNGSQRSIGDPEWVKLFASKKAADAWLETHDPEGVAWEYEIEERQRQGPVSIHLGDEASREIGNPAWAKLFACKDAAQKMDRAERAHGQGLGISSGVDVRTFVERRPRGSNCPQAQRGGLNSPASQPTASVFVGSLDIEICSVRPQVEHSNVRISKPLSPGAIRASAIRCLHAGHIGLSFVSPPMDTLPGRYRIQAAQAVYNIVDSARDFSTPPLPRNGCGADKLIARLVGPPAQRSRRLNDAPAGSASNCEAARQGAE